MHSRVVDGRSGLQQRPHVHGAAMQPPAELLSGIDVKTFIARGFSQHSMVKRAERAAKTWYDGAGSGIGQAT